MIRQTLPFFAFLAITTAVVCAAPTFHQTPACASSVSSIALPTSPPNGDVVVVMGVAVGGNFSGVTATDSNSVSYTQQIQQQSGVSGQAAIALWDKVVAGTPTKTYTLSVPANYCVYDLAGVTYPGTYAFNTQQGTSATSLAATIATIKSTDLELTSAASDNGSISALTTSNGTITSDMSITGNFLSGHTTATSTVSSTATITFAAFDSTAIQFADYTAPIAVNKYGCYPSAGAYPGCQMGDVIFELLLRTA